MGEVSQMNCAIYARHSTKYQTSIEVQFQVCEQIAKRHGFTVVARFCDRALSGGTARRSEYQRMLAAARAHQFEVIVAEDMSRLWRNPAEQSPRLAELSDCGILVVTHDLDTREENSDIISAIGGVMNSVARREIARRVRRTLLGMARDGKHAGGQSYGYIPASRSTTREVEIDPAQAAVVLRIFKAYADGHSPRDIANELNRDGVPCARPKRQERRTAGWDFSAISGNRNRGIGILNNAMYRGERIYNRLRSVRSAADSDDRKYFQNAESDWVVTRFERLRIVPQELWDAVKERQSAQSRLIGDRIKQGLSKAKASRTGAGPKYLASGLLRCWKCGSNYVICGRVIYGCSAN